MDTIRPIFSNYKEFYELYFNISKNFIDENEKSVIEKNNELGFSGESLIENFKYRISTIFTQHKALDELVFDYIPIDFYIPHLNIFSFCNNLKIYLSVEFNSYFKLLYDSYLLNQDRLLHYHIDNLISSIEKTISFLNNIDIDAGYFFDYENENFLSHHYSEDSIHHYKMHLKVLNSYYEKDLCLQEKAILEKEMKLQGILKEIKISENKSFFDIFIDPIYSKSEISIYFEISNLIGGSTLLGISKKADSFKNIDYNMKVFCSSILYFLEYYKQELFENLLLKIDEAPLKNLIKEKIRFSDLPSNNLNKCFLNYEIYDKFYQNYIADKKTNFSEFSMVYHSLKKNNLLLPIREDFFLNELMKYRNDINIGKKTQIRFYRNTTLFSRNYEVKFNRIFKIKKES